MSDLTNTVFATGCVVVVGRWASNETVNVKVVTGGLFLALLLTGISSANERFAQTFATTLLVLAIFTYGLPIAEILGFATTGKVTKPTAGTKVTVVNV
jgi:hypothetical protein